MDDGDDDNDDDVKRSVLLLCQGVIVFGIETDNSNQRNKEKKCRSCSQ